MSFRDRFDTLDLRKWYVADFSMANERKLTAWEDDYVTNVNGKLALSFTATPTWGRPHYKPYTGAEVQSQDYYGYGYYEVKMKVSPENGVVSSFFLFTDTFWGAERQNEIDFEFLGGGVVQLNYYYGDRNLSGVDGRVQIDMGADATDSMHTYGIDWKKNGIAWYIDGIKVHEVTSRSSPVPIPDEKMKIIMNVWSGSAVGWHGELSNEMLAGKETTTYYSRVSYDADGAPYGNQVAMSAPKTLPTFDTLGTRADDVLRGHGRADSINGRRGDDVVAGRGGRDVLTGGKGSDIVRGGGGDDTLVFIESRNRRADDVYVGSSGIDTLEIYCSFDKISGGKLLDEVDDLRAFMRTHYDVDRNGGPTFEFDSIGLSVRSVEDVEVILF